MLVKKSNSPGRSLGTNKMPRTEHGIGQQIRSHKNRVKNLGTLVRAKKRFLGIIKVILTLTGNPSFFSLAGFGHFETLMSESNPQCSKSLHLYLSFSFIERLKGGFFHVSSNDLFE